MKIILYVSFILAFSFGCAELSTSPENSNYEAPAKSFSLLDIFDYQQISSIKFFVYDSTVVNGESAGNFNLNYEIYFDLNRSRIIQYYDNDPWLLSVDDLNNNISWTYNFNTGSTHINDDVNRGTYDEYAKMYLCTHLKDTFILTGDTIIQSMECAVFNDENQTTEWVWKNHRIPIQYKRIMSYDNLYQVTTVQLRNIQPNIVIADSLFILPNIQSAYNMQINRTP